MLNYRLILFVCFFAFVNAGLADQQTLPEGQRRCPVNVNDRNDGPLSMNGHASSVEIEINRIERYRGGLLKFYVEQWNDPSCVLLDGRPRLSAMLRGFSDAIDSSGGDWDKSLARINTLKSIYPDTPIAAIAEAHYWYKYAWDARRSGYASTVTVDGMKLFEERLYKAQKILEDSKTYASSMPLWYEQMLKIKSSQGASEGERDAILKEGVSKYSWYLPLYFIRAGYLTPWWGGSWDAVERFALWSVDQTKAEMGNAMYARVYWAMSGYEQVSNIFKDTKASWPRMKSGFDDLMMHYPSSKWNLNAYARFACDAADKVTYLKLRKKLSEGDALIEEAWKKGRHYEVCDARLGYRS